MTQRPTDAQIERFWSRVRKTRGCWEWTRGKSSGYGTISFGGVAWKAHRLSYFLANGHLPDDLFVCHSCDNRACVRPDHLFLGDNAANMRDMAQKGRSSRLPGSRNGNSKLNDGDVSEIKYLLKNSRLSQTDLGLRYGVSQQTISYIACGRGWEWVEPRAPDDW